ncbi:hypothetical protein NIES2100_63690 [Calothrix sp. NIES-2100]|nr:hypothetical protein NIES2100_63690 [Calothrix sp. NIES-2100]
MRALPCPYIWRYNFLPHLNGNRYICPDRKLLLKYGCDRSLKSQFHHKGRGDPTPTLCMPYFILMTSGNFSEKSETV